jgi:hypothetical protein
VTDPIQPVRRTGAVKRIQGRDGVGDTTGAQRAEAVGAVAPAAPTAPLSPDPRQSPPVLSAQILGQSDTAETAAPAKTARAARAAYLNVEWSGAADRRNRRGRIAKTDI